MQRLYSRAASPPCSAPSTGCRGSANGWTGLSGVAVNSADVRSLCETYHNLDVSVDMLLFRAARYTYVHSDFDEAGAGVTAGRPVDRAARRRPLHRARRPDLDAG